MVVFPFLFGSLISRKATMDISRDKAILAVPPLFEIKHFTDTEIRHNIINVSTIIPLNAENASRTYIKII